MKVSMKDVQTLPLKDISLLDNVREVGDVSELAASIKEQGILEPLVVRVKAQRGEGPIKVKHGEDGYELVCGYRRLAAARLIKLPEVPVVVREMTDLQVREAQLAENLQRQDISVLDEARAYRAYLDGSKATQQDLARRVGKSQSHVAKRLSLLDLPETVHGLIKQDLLSPAHAEALSTVPAELRDVKVGDSRYSAVDWLARLAIGKEGYNQGPLPAKEFAVEVKNRTSKWQRELAVKAELAAAKPCPVCGSPAVNFREYSLDYSVCLGSGFVACHGGHIWNAKSGVEHKEKRAGREGSGGAAKKVPRNEPGTIRSMHTPYAVLLKFVQNLEKVTEVDISEGYGGGHIEVEFDSGKGAAFSALVERHDYATGEKSSVHLGGAYTDPERKKAREAFRKWEEENLPRRVAKTPDAADPKLLEGSIADVIARLDKKGVDDLQLQGLRDLEAKGKSRNGLLVWIDGRLA